MKYIAIFLLSVSFPYIYCFSTSVEMKSSDADNIVGSWYGYIDSPKGFANLELNILDLDETGGNTSCEAEIQFALSGRGSSIYEKDSDIEFKYDKGKLAASSKKFGVEIIGKLQKDDKMAARIKYANFNAKCLMTRTTIRTNEKVPNFISKTLGDVYPSNVSDAYSKCFKLRNYNYAYRLSVFSLVLKVAKPDFDNDSFKSEHKRKIEKMGNSIDYEKANAIAKKMFRDESSKLGIALKESAFDFDAVMDEIEKNSIVMLVDFFPYNFMRQMKLKTKRRMKCADVSAVQKLNSEYNWDASKNSYFWEDEYAVLACNRKTGEILVSDAYSCFWFSKKDYLSLRRIIKNPKMYTLKK